MIPSPLRALPFAVLLVAGCGNAAGGGEGSTTTPLQDSGVTTSEGRDATVPNDAGQPGEMQSTPPGTDAAPVVTSDAAVSSGPCTGKMPTRRGLTMRKVTAAGLNRTYEVYIPASQDPNQAVPLVFVHHGLTMSGQQMYDITLYSQLADREGIAVAFPDGEGGPNSILAPWNVGTGTCGDGAGADATGDDMAFLEAMRADIQTDQCIDTAHVFVTGFSMGGYFAHQVGCIRPDLARAIAPASGATHDLSTCVAGHKPVIIFHGDSDLTIAESCAVTARDAWAAKNGCSTNVMSVDVDGGTCEISQGCPADGQVEFCLFKGMGHMWAGGAPNLSLPESLFSAPNYASATELEWSFYKTYAW